ncbi:MAG: hypothetical protein KDE51_12790, partial [Anaerolineales bacterium]|nr:hypothetical protein [Anaerolineales bacterium]
MKAQVIPTNEIYHEIIAAPDLATRQALYKQKFVAPFEQMMQMFSRDPNDVFSAARAWAWLLPEDLDTVPEQLVKLEAADAWQVAADALHQAAVSFEPYADKIPFDTVTGWLMVADPKRSMPIGRGYTGAMDWYRPQVIGQFDTPNEYNLPRIPGLMVHEMHHLIRMAIFPWNMQTTSVADYIVIEGTAESLAAALFGEEIVGYYVTDISAEDLAIARELIGQNLEACGFDVIRRYIFGDSISAQHQGTEPLGM